MQQKQRNAMPTAVNLKQKQQKRKRTPETANVEQNSRNGKKDDARQWKKAAELAQKLTPEEKNGSCLRPQQRKQRNHRSRCRYRTGCSRGDNSLLAGKNTVLPMSFWLTGRQASASPPIIRKKSVGRQSVYKMNMYQRLENRIFWNRIPHTPTEKIIISTAVRSRSERFWRRHSTQSFSRK